MSAQVKAGEAASAFPFHLERAVWEITLACCFACKYCGSSGGRARAGELTEAEALRVAGELAELGCRRVSLIGGEVFLRPDWDKIVGRLTELGVAVNLITNGFLFDEALLRRVGELRVESVSVSVDGPREVHDKYRQAGSFDRAIRAVKDLAAAGIPVSVISTLNRENAEHLEEFYGILKDLPIFAWQLQACSPMGNAAKAGIDVAFSPASVIRFVAKHASSAPFVMGIADNIGYFMPGEDGRTADGRLRGDLSGSSPFPGCRAGITNIGIDSLGNVRGCESMYDERFNEGNLREKTLREIWENPDGFSYNRAFTPALLTGSCRTCPEGPFCAGGCRSYNYFVHDRLYEAPRCARNEKSDGEV